MLPNIVEVTEESWATHKFDRFTALKIKDAGDGEHNGVDKQTVSQYDFFINVDNLYLKIEMKSAKSDASLLKARFMYGMVLVGLGLLQQDVAAQSKKTKRPEADEDEDGAGALEHQWRTTRMAQRTWRNGWNVLHRPWPLFCCR